MTTINKNYAGVDICEEFLDIFLIPDNIYQRLNNNTQGITDAINLMKQHDISLVAMEATGGLQRNFVNSLQKHKIATSVVNPERIWAYKKLVSQKDKSDKIDAKVIAQFAKHMNPEESNELSDDQIVMQELSSRRLQLTENIAAEKKRLARISDERVIKSVNDHIDFINKELKNIENLILKMIEKNPKKQKDFEILCSIPGIGKVTAASLIIDMPELGQISDKAISSLSGLAPVTKESGKYKGVSSISGGRKHVRKKLYMPTLTAKKCNLTIKAFYERLIKNGKSFKQAITACMRKMLVIANRMIKTQTMWNEKKVAV